ncbi:hypothetical protein ACFFQF_25395 [Haladaptatus pallidirubidus]|uniref:hypothetical protein n=1 Tax=Haladaptatus pallidirubidus TaxID=1008152 RepID=UPI001D1144F8|nr:hypothetical protein [Haladaptatus pallidirubidus]
MNRNTIETESEHLPRGRESCKRCRSDAIFRVVRTAIDGASHPVQKPSPAASTLCQDCFAQLRADPNESFATLFDREFQAVNQYIKVKRL